MHQEQSGLSEIPAPAHSLRPDGFLSGITQLNRVVMFAAPLCPIAIGITAGIVIDERIALGTFLFPLMLVAASAAAASSRLREQFAVLLLFAAGICVGGLRHWSRDQIPPTSVENLVQKDESIIRVRGQIVSDPTIIAKDEGIFTHWQFQEDSTAFLLQVESVKSDNGWRIASGTIKATIREAVLDLDMGDSIELFGRLVALAPPRNPGSFDWRSYYRLRGVVARMYCDQRENIVRLGRTGSGFAPWLREKSLGLLTDDIAASAAEEASLLEAMVLGHRSRFDRRLNEVFTRAGCVHFIAASGTNIVVLMAAVWFAGRLFGLDKRRCALVMIVVIVLYGVSAEARPPILRACVMGIMFCIALLFQRATSHLNWICAAAVVLCLIDPMTVFDAGFQLSFAAVFGVAYLAPAIWHAFKDTYWWFRHVVLRDEYALADRRLYKVAAQFTSVSSLERIARGGEKCARATAFVFALSLGAWLSSVFITAQWFQRVQPLGIISSVVVAPFMSIVMILGFLKVCLAAISPTLAYAVTLVLNVVDSTMIYIVEWMADLPVPSPVFAPLPWWQIVSFYLLLLMFAVAFRPRSETEPVVACVNKPSRSSIRVLAAMALVFAGVTVLRFRVKDESRLTVTVLSVGAGSAMVMELPDGETILYDAGSLGVAAVGKNVIAPFLRHRGIRRVDRIYVSHPNLDHFSGIPELLAEIPIGAIALNHCFEFLLPPHSPGRTLVGHLKSLGHAPERLDAGLSQWEIGGVRFEKLWPASDDCAHLTANDSSTVLKVSYANHTILLTGDISEVAERALIRSPNVTANVLLLPHHGSVCPSTGGFLKAVNADVLIRSSHHRLADTDNGLKELIGSTRVYNTADCGAVTIVVDQAGRQVDTWLACSLD